MYGTRGQAWLDAARGEPVRARALLLDHAAELVATGCRSHAIRALLDVARLGDPKSAALALEPIVEAVDGRALLAFAQFVRGLAAGDGSALAEVTEQLAEMGYAGLAAEAANAARDELARDGRSRDASRLTRRAVELTAATEGGATPLLRAADTFVPLTRREREIASLVAEGRTSREVADACFVSVRTVEGHLARIYDELGIRNRAELAAAMAPMMVG